MNLPEGYVLAVGLKQSPDLQKNSPVHLCFVDTGFQALQKLRCRLPSVIVGLWDLPDMPDGAFFKRVSAAAVTVPTVILVRFGDTCQEVAARSLGVTVVLDDNIDEQTLRKLISQLSSIELATGT